MGGQPAKERTPCEQAGDNLCARVDNALMCVSDGANFQCACKTGFESSGRNASSSCKDINECATEKNDCATRIKNSICSNTEGSYTCTCGNYRTLNGNICEDINECLQNRGGCGDFSDCVNQEGAPVRCDCWTGYTGNDGQPGTDCKDIDECATTDICGAHAKCINTPGSYRCECNTGYTLSSSNICEPVNFCGTGQNTCDPNYADCVSTDGSYECRCKDYFQGSGKKGSCTPMSGYENLACELIGQKCTAYQECAPDSLGSYSCTEKATMAQLAAFFSEGGSSDTPFWIWITVGVGAIFLILLLWGLIRYFLKKGGRSGDAAPIQQADAYGYGYGAMQYAY